MKQFDIIVIGMGPTGIAVEKYKVGGECLNCGWYESALHR